MSKKTIITIALVAVLGFFGYRAYAARPVRFVDNAWGGALTGDDACFDSTAAGPVTCGSVGFVFNEKHGFKKGDMVDVQQDKGTNVYYNGKAKVLWVSDTAIIINKGFGESTPPEGGTIKKVM